MTVQNQNFDIVVVGAGPAGSVCAAQLQKYGHRVCVIDSQKFPREHIGESLSPGIWHHMQTLGLTEALQASKKFICQSIEIHWPGSKIQRRELAGKPGIIIKRSDFDYLLLNHAVAAGVQLKLEHRLLSQAKLTDYCWSLTVLHQSQTQQINCKWLIDASGRARACRGTVQKNTRKTLCLVSYLPFNENAVPFIKAFSHGWLWGMPLPDKRFNLMLFVDASYYQKHIATQQKNYFSRVVNDLLLDLAKTQPALKQLICNLQAIKKISVVDATSYYSTQAISDQLIMIGESALALDPLSSSGVEKALQTSISAAIVVNTLLKKPHNTQLAKDYYQQLITQSARQHQQWADDFYAQGAPYFQTGFWQRDANNRVKVKQLPKKSDNIDNIDKNRLEPERITANSLLNKSTKIRYIQTAALTGQFIEAVDAIQHPNFTQAFSFIADFAIASFLKKLPDQAFAAAQLYAQLSIHTVPDKAKYILNWLIQNELLVTVNETHAPKYQG
ncbi:flavin-dependent monooxygenase QhpG [Catenovulum sediminis]|uniref:Tryptophan 7-halogenase n=1 Tax=Catenovulum sediminis TaxID=1740262 RepID=A0ABV1RFM9_9ALTE